MELLKEIIDSIITTMLHFISMVLFVVITMVAYYFYPKTTIVIVSFLIISFVIAFIGETIDPPKKTKD